MDEYIGFVYFWENLHPDIKTHNKYIGQHIGKITDPYKGSGTIFLKRFYCKKYRNFWKRTILQQCKTIDELNNAEIYWISKYDACNNDQFCNIREGGKNGKHSEKTKHKISVSLKGNQAWNKGIKGLFKASSETKEKRKISSAAYYEPIMKQREEYTLSLILKNGSIKVKELMKHEGFTFKKAADTIKRLYDKHTIKMFYFGTNDLRYVLPDFSIEDSIIEFIKNSQNCTLPDIMLFIKTKYGIGKNVTRVTCRKLCKDNIIKNTRGYRKNFYTYNAL